MRRALFGLAAAAIVLLPPGSPGGARAQTTPVADTAMTVEAPEDLIGRMTAPVHINGQGPFRFIVDTGANRTSISASLAARLGLPIVGESEVHAFTGAFIAPLAQVNTLTSGAVRLDNAALPIIETSMLANADGLLGVEALQNRRLIFDFRAQQIRLERGSSRLSGPRWFSARAERRFGDLFVMRGLVGSVSVHMIIDTGANQSFANVAFREALRGSAARAAPVTGTRLTAAGSRPVVLDQAIYVPRVDFATLEVRNVVAYVGDLYIFALWGLNETPTLVLGMDFLSKLDALALDYGNGTVSFRGTRGAGPERNIRLMH